MFIIHKRVTLAIVLMLSATSIAFSQNKKAVYLDKNAAIEARVKDLLSRMTLEEKAGQLNQINYGMFTGPDNKVDDEKAKLDLVRQGKIGSFLNTLGVSKIKKVQQIAVEQSRLKIPLLFGFDVIHGYKTLFPIPLAEACSWDMEQVFQNSRIAAKESAASGLNWAFAPMCDISNDPRWGRVMEGAGEDPYYGSIIAAQRVKGFQGNLDGVFDILACVKHFAVYGAVEAGREYNNVDVSRTAFYNKYLPPYEAAVKSGAATVMTSFNVFDGVPASGNKFLLTDILQNRLGFKGFVVSDWNAFAEMIAHGYAFDRKDAVYKALKAGSMMDMESRTAIEFIPELVKEGKISEAVLDKAVGAILYYKFKLGLFENPYRFLDEKREKENVFTAENRLIAREAAKKSILLLKNEKQQLPITNPNQKIALIGFYANSKPDMVDMWKASANADQCITTYEGLKRQFPNLSYAEGYKKDNTTSEELIAEAVKNAQAAESVIVNIGITNNLSGEDKSLADINIPQGQINLLKALKKTGKPIITLVSSGRPMILTEIQNLSDAIVQCWVLGTETGNAIAEVLSGKYNPSAKTVMSFPYALGQIPVYYNHFNTGRPAPEANAKEKPADFYSRFHDIPNDPLYPFGFGLSYATFEYSNLQLSSKNITKKDSLTVTVDLKNTGKYDGEEVAQLYIQDVTASIVRPVKELKGFKKLMLKAGEKKTLEFKISADDLKFYDHDGNSIVEQGIFKIYVGGNSRDVLGSSFELK
ncbi:glycoside hydrolase family 3 N-terminal domain-containing protein [Flavobacterium sp. 3-210]